MCHHPMLDRHDKHLWVLKYTAIILHGVRCWSLNHYSLCLHQPGLHKWKVKISSKCFDLNCDPDQWERSFPSFVDKLPNQFPVFSTLLDMNFPRTLCTTKALTPFSYGSFHMWRNRGQTFMLLLKPNTALYLKLKTVKIDATRRVLMQHTWEKMQQQKKTVQVWNPPPCSHITWGVCVWWQMENSVAEQCFLETSDRKGGGYNSHCCIVTNDWLDYFTF